MNYKQFQKEFPAFLANSGVAIEQAQDDMIQLQGDYEKLIFWGVDPQGVQYGKYIQGLPFVIPQALLAQDSDELKSMNVEGDLHTVLDYLNMGYSIRAMTEGLMPGMLTIKGNPPWSGFSSMSLEDDVLPPTEDGKIQLTSTLLFIPEYFEYSQEALFEKIQAADRILGGFIDQIKETIDKYVNALQAAPSPSPIPALSITGHPLKSLGTAKEEAFQRVLYTFNSMNKWLNEIQQLADQYGGRAMWNSDGDEYFEDLTSALDKLITLYPKHLGNDLYGFISSTFLFWSMRFDVYQGVIEGHCRDHKTLEKYRQLFSLPKSWYRCDFSQGAIEWQFPDCVPQIQIEKCKDFDEYIANCKKHIMTHEEDEDIKEAYSAADQETLRNAFADLFIAGIRYMARFHNGILEVLIDDIYVELKKRSDYHINQLLMVLTYFRQAGLRVKDGFDIFAEVFSLITPAMTPLNLGLKLKDSDYVPALIKVENHVRISQVETLAKEVAHELCQSGLPSDYDKKKAWKLDLRLPHAMPYDSMQQEWIESFHLSADGKIILPSSMSPVLPIGFGEWAEIDFVGLIESLQWSSSFKWEKDSGGGDWAYPTAEGFSSASDATGVVIAALNKLKIGITQRKRAEEKRKETEALRMAEEQRRQQAEQQRLLEEQRRQEAQAQQWAAQGLCRFCGGKLALIGRTCKSCGKKN